MSIRKRLHGGSPPEVAANGLIDRRALLGRGVLIAGAMGTGVGTALTSAAAEPLPVDPWSLEIGTAIPPYGLPAKYEKNVVRTRSPIPTTSRAPAWRARRTICSMVRSHRTVCISWCRAPGFPTLTRISTGS